MEIIAKAVSGDPALSSKIMHFENVGIHLAIIEILAFILEKSFECPESLALSVMVRSTNQTLDDLTWFYIKVLSSYEIKKEDLIGQRFFSLYELLNRMQSNEVESHLCLQQPIIDGQSGSVQENLILKDNKLITQEVQIKAKNSRFYTVYLRVHLKIWQMSTACAELHDYMVLSRIFRPKDRLSFSMNFGEVVIETDFRVKTSQKVSSILPEIVTDSKFYSKKRETMSYRLLRMTPNMSAARVCGDVQKQLNSDCQPIDIDLVGLCYQQAEDGVDDSKQSSINITVFGPGFVPYTGYIFHIEDMIKYIDWGHFDMKFTTVHKAFKGSKWNDLDIKQVFEDSIKDIKQKLGEIFEQVLQPYLSKAKTRSVLNRSIKSVCKGVTDVISMSSSDAFRSRALETIKASDTLDLSEKLELALKDISSRKYAGMFPQKLLPSDVATEDKIITDPKQDLEDDPDQIVPAISSDHEPAFNDENLACGTQMEEPGDNYGCNLDLTQTRSNSKCPSTGYNQTKRCNFVNNLTIGQIEAGERCRSQTNTNETAVSPFCELGEEEDKTPEINQLTKCFKEVSPFQELAVEETLDEDPYIQDNTEKYTCSRTMDKSIKVIFSTEILEKSIPFSPTGECNRTIDKDHIDDKTPEINELTDLFKEVSPFQELAETEMNMEEEMLHEDPFKEIKDGQVINKIQTITNQTSHSLEDLEAVSKIKNDANTLYIDSVNQSSNLHPCDSLTDKNLCGTLFEETSLKGTEHPVDCLEEDSDDWFNDVLMGVDHWLK